MPTFLSANDWKKLLKEQPDAGEAAPLTKALEAYEKVEGKDDPVSLETALEQVVTRAKAVKSKNAKNKKLIEFLDGVVSTAAKEKAKAAAEKAADSLKNIANQKAEEAKKKAEEEAKKRLGEEGQKKVEDVKGKLDKWDPFKKKKNR